MGGGGGKERERERITAATRLTELDSQRSKQRSEEESSDPEDRSDFGFGGLLDVPANATTEQTRARGQRKSGRVSSTSKLEEEEGERTWTRTYFSSLLIASGLLKSLTNFPINNADNPTISFQ